MDAPEVSQHIQTGVMVLSMVSGAIVVGVSGYFGTRFAIRDERAERREEIERINGRLNLLDNTVGRHDRQIERIEERFDTGR